jgi:hypothetical protein
MKSNVTVDTEGLEVILTSVAARVKWLRDVAHDARCEPDETRRYWEVSLQRAEKLYGQLLSGSIVNLLEDRS